MSQRRRGIGGGRSRRGSAAVGVIIALVLLQLVVVAAVVGGGREQDVRARQTEAARAQYAADAATQMAIRELSVNADEDGDGTIGAIASNVAAGKVFNSAALRATVVTSSGVATVSALGSQGIARRATQCAVRTPVAASGTVTGVYAEYWNLAANPGQTTNVNWNATPTAVGIAPNLNWANTSSGSQWANSTTRFAGRFRGQVNVPTAGTWTFFLSCDDGGRLFVNGAELINHDGAHGMSERSATVTLTAGWADVEVRYFDQGGSAGLIVSWSGPGVAKEIIPRWRWRATPTATVPAVAATGAVTLTGDGSANAANIDGYNPSGGLYSSGNRLTSSTVLATNSTASGAMALSNRATVYGNVLVGVGGSPGTVVATSGSASITGTQTAATVGQAMIRPSPPTAPATSGVLSGTGSLSLNSDRRYTSFALTGNNTTLTISGNVVIQVDTTFSMSNRAQIVLAPGASLQVFVGTTVSIIDDAELNPDGDPANVLMVMTGNAQAMTLSDKVRVFGHLLNPRGSVALSGNSANATTVWGTVRAASFSMTQKTQVHGDMRGNGSSTSSPMAITAWAEGP